MSKYKNELSNQRFHIQSLRFVIAMLTLICGILAYGWYSAPKQLTIYNPPDLRTGSTRAWWEVPLPNVYAFGLYVFQQLNHWAEDGEKDYIGKIHQLRGYLTPQCYADLQADFERRKTQGELQKRVRHVYEIPGRGYDDKRVKINSESDWYVDLDLTTDEYYLDSKVKRVLVRYPVHIVKMDVNPETNPFGLGLDCYYDRPKRIEYRDPNSQPNSQNAPAVNGSTPEED